MKNLKKQVRKGKVTEEVLGNVIFSFNRGAKKERGSREDLYRMKTELLREFFFPKEIHLLNGKEYLYYEVGRYKFHIPHASLDYSYKGLEVFLMDRANPPKRRRMSCLPLEFCLYLYNNKNHLSLAN
ncbi:hypothetical protein PM10SUCC1_32880 [Propionigenium maris DSM 9537]|uniref:Uncharacterized protein n=1 Tax=Propionigenium maris DSM 9537 TaxID=1123000 RepID=A0A9W6GMF3_9FUSO|nr:hypothetical protein [Propionigenium maris]GLI57774.1 hypothetical protein PM10SUCC1_32880 [Propionigenium maris DSM 9537]